ncbi:hypothetical protein H257_03297 [Aphanomyces astaci]|uniref:Uncharacterized protein n=1 Tax=Aphanomyces astaci TaxID=112090 RepID=W4H2Z3_APHAT|nr:hypothetical protein H257_03297 [Aphanomyces astaci]ETV85589.1 hypothetical protein H257_03297 [Aphanomyces astaci]|eukprot:XP_009825607.1 hypothetical protein H257_03297 [Aphanomyces astaci]
MVHSSPTWRWCKHGAANRLRCLADVVAVHGRWPTRPEFMVMMSQGNPAAPVEINRDGHMHWAPVHRSGMIYNHLTRMHTQVQGLHQLPPNIVPVPESTRHPFYGMVKDTPTPFELWPRPMVVALAYHAPASEVSHPMTSTTRTTTALIQSYVRRVETQHHAFHACPRIHPVWSFHRDAWRPFGAPFTWSTISDLDLFTVNSRGDRHKDAVKTLWILLTASTLNLIWTQHNKVQYTDASPLLLPHWFELSLLGWMPSVRRKLRLQDRECPIRTSALHVLHTLRDQANYRRLW